MLMKNKCKHIVFGNIVSAVFILFFSQILFSQTTLNSFGAEELFNRARVLAFNNQRDSARILLNLALKKNLTYADARIFLARTLAWDGKRTEARKELKTVIAQQPFNIEALLFAVDVELWDSKPADALKVCSTGLKKFPNHEDFLVKKAKILRDLNRETEALVTLAALENINPSNSEMQTIRESIKSNFMNQGISAGETFDWYTKVFDPSHLIALQYNYSTYFGTIFARLNYRTVKNNDGVQFEVDAYPRIIDGIYAYVSYGFAGSASLLFPEHRAGLEAFFKLPSSFESSIGGRYLNFGKGKDITIYTGSLGYYYKDYWFSLRPYITPSSVNVSRSINLISRWYYNGTAEEYASVKVATGFSPDERNYDATNSNVYLLKASSFGIGWQKPFGIYSLVNVNVDYTRQELAFRLGDYVEVYSLFISYRYKF